MPATSRFRVSLGGLADAERATIRHLLADGGLNAAPQWDVTDEGCQAIVVDPEAECAGSALGRRPFGALVILALRPGETAWPGTLALVRPFDARQLDLTLNLAAQIIAQPAFSVQAPPATDFDVEGTSAELEESVEASTQEAPLFVEAVEEAAAIEESQAIEQEEAEAAELADADATEIEATVAEAPDDVAAEGADAPIDEMEVSADDDEADDKAQGTDDDADPFDSPGLSEAASDDAIDRLTMAALGEGRLPDRDATAGEDTDTDDSDDEGDTAHDPSTDQVVHLHHEDDDEPVDLLSFPSPDDVDPLDIAFAKVEQPAMFGKDAATTAADEPEGEARDEDTAEDLITSLDAAAQDLIEFDHVGSDDSRPGPFDDLLVRHEQAVPDGDEKDDSTPSFMAPVGRDEPVEPAAEHVEAAAARPSSAPPHAPQPSEEMPEPTVALEDVDSLALLATAYREQLYRARHVVVTVGDDTFHLEPYTGSYYSSSPPETLSYSRGRDSVRITIETRDEAADDRPGEPLRLVNFLWHLGFQAGDGMLLPWVDPEARYRIMRQPPMNDDAKETGVLQIAQLLASSPVAAADIARLAGADDITVTDFLNGCSLVGYLERVAMPVRRAPRATGARSRASQASLIGNLRKRMGLSE